MILAAQTISFLCRNNDYNDPMIDPFVQRTVHPYGMSYGLSSCGYDVRAKVLGVSEFIKPGGFLLISTIERFNLPDDVAGFVMDKSTWARQGIALQNTILEPGWCGHITLEVSNHGDKNVVLDTGVPICQVIFQRLDQETSQPYRGKYQDQSSLPVGARFEATDD